MKRFILINICLILAACVPESESDFNTFINVYSGDGLSLELDEDTTKKFSYSVPVSEEDSVNPTYVISKNPSHGSLLGCDTSDLVTIDCTYVPDSNFNGQDSIEIIGKDGGIMARASAKIIFKVNPVSDAPEISGAHSISVAQNTSYIFEAIKGTDVDGDQLTYIITQGSSQGQLSNCFLGSSLHCTYTPNLDYIGADSLKYKVRDSSGLESAGEATLNILVSKNIIYSKTDIFTIKGSGITKVDIVWVIDNSGSMKDEQTALQNNFASFINGFFNQGQPKFDFNMMVTTTDAYQGNNPRAVIDPQTNALYNLSSLAAVQDYAKFQSDFTNAVGVGVQGSGDERSLLSLQSNYAAYSNWFGGAESLLVYIILSDEKEQSYSKTIAEWTLYIKSLKADPTKSKVYPIIRLQADDGNRYAELANVFGTQLSSIEAPFDTILNAISTDISSQTNSLTLSVTGIIIENSIMVKINGTTLAADQYVYNPVAKSIQFMNVLPVNAQVEIGYNYTLK